MITYSKNNRMLMNSKISQSQKTNKNKILQKNNKNNNLLNLILHKI
jgi:hypothetical protein